MYLKEIDKTAGLKIIEFSYWMYHGQHSGFHSMV